MDIKKSIAHCAKELSQLPYSLGNEPMIYVKEEGKIFTVKNGSDFSNIGPEDIVDCTSFSLPEKEALLEDAKASAYIVAAPPFVLQCIKAQKAIRPCLGDTAMMIGCEAGLAGRHKPSIKAAICGNNACLLVDAKKAVVKGRTLPEAFTVLTVLEKSAEVIIKAEALGGPTYLGTLKAKWLHAFYTAKYSKKSGAANSSGIGGDDNSASRRGSITDTGHGDNYGIKCNSIADNGRGDRSGNECGDKYGNESDDRSGNRQGKIADNGCDNISPQEMQKRKLLVQYGKELLQAGLVQGTFGNLSLRLDDEYFLVTPSGMDYDNLSPLDEVKVRLSDGTYEGPPAPTSERELHRLLYLARPNIGAIVHTHSTACCVYGAARMPLVYESQGVADSATGIIPPSLLLPVAKYGPAGSKKLAQNVVHVMNKAPGCIMQNHGMVCGAAEMEAAFSLALAIEKAAAHTITERMQPRTNKEPLNERHPQQ